MVLERANKRVFVAGNRGLAGAALRWRLERSGVEVVTASRATVDLTNERALREYLAFGRFDAVCLAAGRSGGVLARSASPGEFLYTNAVLALQMIEAAHRAQIPQLLYLASAAVYSPGEMQPTPEPVLSVNGGVNVGEPVAMAHLAGLHLCETYNLQFGRDYRSVILPNLYGPSVCWAEDEQSYVVPSLLRRFHEARERSDKVVTVWGSGRARREFLHVDDMAQACVQIMGLEVRRYRAVTGTGGHVNVAMGEDCTIRELAEIVARVTGYTG